MIYVTSLEGSQVEPLVNIGKDFNMEQSTDGTFIVSFSCSKGPDNINPGYNLLEEEAVITVEDNNFRIKQLKEKGHIKNITAISTFYDLIDKRKNEIYGGTHTFNEFLTFVLGGTAWSFTFDGDLNDHRFIENFGENNIIALVQALCKVYECEYVIMPNNHIHFSKQLGGDYDFQYRYGHNVKALSKNVDTTNLKTYIEGFGTTNEGTGGQLWVSYESPYAQKYGKREAEPIHDDRFTHADSLLEHIKSMLTDFPEASFELDSIELTSRELGERIWLIYDPMDMEFQTRILSQNKGFVNGKLTTISVVLGNRIPRSTSDILISQKVEIDEHKKITRSRFEQTNSQILMAVETIGESISELKLTDKEINARVDETNKSVANLNIKADQIEAKVTDRVDNMESTFTIRANQIESSVRSVDDRVDKTETKIDQTNNYIDLQVVKKSEYTGEDIVTKINLQPDWVKVKAKNIELDGAVISKGSITGETTISVGTDLTVGNNIYMKGPDMGNRIHFWDSTNIYNYGDEFYIEAGSQMSISAPRVVFHGSVDFSQAWNVTGLKVDGGNADTVRGIYLAYNSTYVYLRNAQGQNLAQLKRSDTA